MDKKSHVAHWPNPYADKTPPTKGEKWKWTEFGMW